MKSETITVEKKDVTVEDVVMMLKTGAEIECGKIKTGYDQEICEYTYKDVGIVKLCENGAETTITLDMSEMVEIIKHLVK